MSDYTVSDKAPGEQWTAQDHNAMKVAVNSKMDKDKLVQDFNNPNAANFPSSLAVANYLAGSFLLRGNLNGSEQIMTGTAFQLSGYWVAEKGFNVTNAGNNAEYPINLPGVLKVHTNKDHKLLEYMTLGDKPRYFISSRVSNQQHFDWTEMVSPSYLAINNYCQCTHITTAPGTNVIDSGTGGIYTLDRVVGDRWDRSVIRISADKVMQYNDHVFATFSWEDPIIRGKLVTVNNYQENNCKLLLSSIDDNSFTVAATEFSAQNDGQVDQFFFSILIL